MVTDLSKSQIKNRKSKIPSLPFAMRRKRVFILSPAHVGGERAQLIYNDLARFELARQVRTPAGAPLGEVFRFLSGLYFRGKLAYAEAFADPPRGTHGVVVITTNRGLLPAPTPVTVHDLRAMAKGDIDTADPAYRGPLERDARLLADTLGDYGEAVLLGSIATGKYVDILFGTLGSRLLFPREFVGRGDMSRGGLMLRCVTERRELTYVPVHGENRRGPRPARLDKRSWVGTALASPRDSSPQRLQAPPCALKRKKR
jgi:hypothetical protein